MSTSIRISTSLVAASLLGACASYANVRFQPNPVDVTLAQSEGGPALGRALVSVRGIRATDDDGHELYLLLRLDNDGDLPLSFLAEECELVDGSLESLPPPRVSRRGAAGADPLEVAPGETGVFDLVFDFPEEHGPDDYDLGSLNLRWALRAGSTTQRHSSSFERAYGYHDGYYAPGYYWPGPYYRGYYGYHGYHGWCW